MIKHRMSLQRFREYFPSMVRMVYAYVGHFQIFLYYFLFFYGIEYSETVLVPRHQ